VPLWLAILQWAFLFWTGGLGLYSALGYRVRDA